MLSVSRSHPPVYSALSHVRRIASQADWDARPTFCYRLRAAVREALAGFPRNEDVDQRVRAVIRAAEHFANALRPNFTPTAVELMARIDELELACERATAAQSGEHARAAYDHQPAIRLQAALALNAYLPLQA